MAFAGRSNAGKSSALNALAGVRSLARTSKAPGRTREINFFAWDPERRLADLPGYGYARVPRETARRWAALLERYLQRRCLAGLVLLMDARHPLTPLDRQLLDLAACRRLPVLLLLTKADKLGRGAALEALRRVRRELPAWGEATASWRAVLFSARTRLGVPEARQAVDVFLNQSVM